MKKIYSRTYYSIENIINSIGNRISGLQKNKIESAYDFADRALENQKLNDVPIFFHSTRVTGILIKDYQIFNPDLINTCLLADIYKSEQNISSNIIDINFGPYIAYLIERMSGQDEFGMIDIEHLKINFERTDIPIDDFLTVWLIKHLDIIRCIDYGLTTHIIDYIYKFSKLINIIPEITNNPNILKILNDIKQERNKLLC